MYCKNCGKEIDDKAEFCIGCGMKICPVLDKPSNWWYLLPIFLGLIGGIIGYLAIRNKNNVMARNMLVVGTVIFIFLIIINIPSSDNSTNSERVSTSNPTDKIPLPKDLSEIDKNSYPNLDIRDVMKSPPNIYFNKNIHLSGEVGWIQEYECGTDLICTQIIIDYIGDNDQSVSVYYDGRLPGIYQGITVEIYGIIKGRDTIQYKFTEAKFEVPKIYAINIRSIPKP